VLGRGWVLRWVSCALSSAVLSVQCCFCSLGVIVFVGFLRFVLCMGCRVVVLVWRSKKKEAPRRSVSSSAWPGSRSCCAASSRSVAVAVCGVVRVCLCVSICRELALCWVRVDRAFGWSGVLDGFWFRSAVCLSGIAAWGLSPAVCVVAATFGTALGYWLLSVVLSCSRLSRD